MGETVPATVSLPGRFLPQKVSIGAFGWNAELRATDGSGTVVRIFNGNAVSVWRMGTELWSFIRHWNDRRLRKSNYDAQLAYWKYAANVSGWVSVLV